MYDDIMIIPLFWSATCLVQKVIQFVQTCNPVVRIDSDNDNGRTDFELTIDTP